MSDSESDEVSESQREHSDIFPAQLEPIAEALRELFNLLEQYAPVWYTEEHHERAAPALRVLEEFRERAKSEAARPQRRVDTNSNSRARY